MDNEAQRATPQAEPTYLPWLYLRPAIPDPTIPSSQPRVLTRPLHGPLLLPNASSEIRDLCASERTFLSNLRLGTYLALVAGAIVVQFHFADYNESGDYIPRPLDRRVALGLSAVFAVYSLIWLSVAVTNYVRTVEGYARKRALVQSGWKTNSLVGSLGVMVLATCLYLVVVSSPLKKGREEV
ncbi:MAG: hypothetical protein Q9162_007030 [Coniocarpon cinnabarinum]